MVFETTRTIMRQLVPDDSDFILRLVNTPGWLAYIGDRGIHNREEACKYLITGPIESYHCHGYGLWMVLDKNENTPLGICGLLKRNTLPEPDLGFAFMPEFHNLGYANESVNAVLLIAAERFRLSTLLAITVPANHRSIRLLQKNGFSFEKEITDPQTGAALHLFRVRLPVSEKFDRA